MTRNTAKAFLNFQIDLKSKIEPQIDPLVSDETLARAAYVSRLEPDEETLKVLRKGLHEAIETMVDGILQLKNTRPEKQENKALERVSREASHLYEAISDLMEFGHTEDKLYKEVMSCQTLATGPNGESLKDILTKEKNPFFYLREIIVDLEVCAEQAINRMPNLDPESVEFHNAISQAETGESYETVTTMRYKARSKAYQTPKDLPLQNFLKSFGATWSALTQEPFSEGMHYSELGKTSSRGVDAAKVILDCIVPDVTRPMIVTALRKIRRT